MESITIRNKKINHEHEQKAFWLSVENAQWEQHTFDVLDKCIKPGSTFLDIGAWNGVLSLYAATSGAQCYSVEPDEAAHKFLAENIELNPELRSRIRTYQVAMSSETGVSELKSADGSWGNSMSSLLNQVSEPKDRKPVNTTTLDDFIFNNNIELNGDSLIKIDIEGGECILIPKIKNILSKYKPRVYLSLHPFWFPDFINNTIDIAKAIFPTHNVLLSGTKEINEDEFIELMKSKNGIDVVLEPRKHKIALIIPTFNRPEYLAQCMDSVGKLTTRPSRIIIVDDESTDADTLRMIENYGSYFEADLIRNGKNSGIKESVKNGTAAAFGVHDCDIAIILDSDAIVKPDFLEKVVSLHLELNEISSGFNCSAANKPAIKTGEGYALKSSCNGINLCFNRWQYKNYVLPSLNGPGDWDNGLSAMYVRDGLFFAVVVPSVVQHIGAVSTMGHYPPDVANDF